MSRANSVTSHTTDGEFDVAHSLEASPGEIAIGVIIGRTSEFFDFFVYAIASVLVFPKLVFPYLDPLQGTLASFAVFALAFLVRPLGTVAFMAIDRLYGRGTKLTIAMFMMGCSTVALAFLPGYVQAGNLSLWLLAILRIGQGLAMGAAWDGLASLLAMNAPAERRGWYAMIPQLGALLGLMVATSLFAYFVSSLSAEDFLDWGWRYPFFVAFAINVVALFTRVRIVVAPEYASGFLRRALAPASVRDTVRAAGRNVAIGAFAPLASFALFHTVTVFPLSWVFLYTRESPARFLVIELVGAAIGVAAIVASGVLADRIGRRTFLAVTACAIGFFSGFAPQLLNAGDVGEAIYMLFGFVLLGLSFGQASGVVAASFSSLYRYTGSALTNDLAWLFGAGFAPFVALALSSRFGLMAAGAYLLSGAVITVIALLLDREQRQRQERDAA
jgi:MFS family permease